MANKLLRNLAITLGGGLAFGVGMKLGQSTAGKERSGPGVDLEPLTERLKGFEDRVKKLEITGVSNGPGVLRAEAFDQAILDQSLAAVEDRLALQVRQVDTRVSAVEARAAESLGVVEKRQEEQLASIVERIEKFRTEVRTDGSQADQKNAALYSDLEQKLKALESRLPGEIDRNVATRIADLRASLRTEFDEAQARTLDAFVNTIETRVVQRINTLEGSLTQQSEAMGGLREKSLRTDQNMQKLLLAVEQLCDQTARHLSRQAPEPETRAPAPEAAPVHQPPEPVRLVTRVVPEPPEETPPVPESVPADRPPEPVELVSQTAPELREETPPAPPVEVQPVAPPIPEPAVPAQELASSASPVEPIEETVPAVAASQPPAEPEPAAKKPEGRFDAEVLELLSPPPKKERRWRIPLAFSLIVMATGLVGLHLLGAFQAPWQPEAIASASSMPELPAALPEPDPAPPAKDLRVLESRVSANPHDTAALMDLGREYSSRKEWKKAESAFRSAARVSPKNHEAILALSDVLYQQQKYEESAAVRGKLSPMVKQ